MNARQIAALRFAAWIPVVFAVLFGMNWDAKVSVDRPDVVNAASLQADAEAQGAWCWSGGSDLTPNAVIVSVVKTGEVKITRSQRMIDRAIEQAVFGEDRGIVVHAFCQTL